MEFSATYSPEDNKLRITASERLPKELYLRFKENGFRWAPMQKVFYSQTWSPGREAFAVEMAGEIGDEDTSLVQRAEERAERFDGYKANRKRDAMQAKASADATASNIPFGQPILVGHHSQRRAERDAKKIQNNIDRAVKMWDTAQYWEDRAAGAIAAAKYKEVPAVRARRIKKIKSDLRRVEKSRKEAEQDKKNWERVGSGFLKHKDSGETCTPLEEAVFLSNRMRGYTGMWSDLDAGKLTADQAKERVFKGTAYEVARCAKWEAHYNNRIAYENAMMAESGGLAANKFTLEVGGRVLDRWGDWCVIVRINKARGEVSSVTVAGRHSYIIDIERIKDYQPPEEGAAAAVKKVTKLAPLCNYDGEGFHHFTAAEWKSRYERPTTRIKATDTHKAHRVRHCFKSSDNPNNYNGKYANVFITDAKVKEAPAVVEGDEVKKRETVSIKPIKAAPKVKPEPVKEEAPEVDEGASFEALREAAKNPVKVEVIHSPTFYPTPIALAARVVELAEIEDGQRVLEPSAGAGAILEQLDFQIETVAIEIDFKLASMLKEKFTAEIIQGDFMEQNGNLGTFDRIVMNPPFNRGQDIKHIRHAFDKLRAGGRLVAICADGPRQRAAFEEIATQYESLPAGTFKAQGTNVNTALLVIDK